MTYEADRGYVGTKTLLEQFGENAQEAVFIFGINYPDAKLLRIDPVIETEMERTS